MGLIDFILNLAGLLFWLNWRAARFNPLNRRSPATLMGTLRPAAPTSQSRWPLLIGISVLLLLRGLVYRWISSYSSVWSGTVNLQVIVLSFRSDSYLRMLEFSLLSFALTLGIFYSWLLLLSILAGPEPLHRLVKVQLGRVDDWPRWMKFLLPIVMAVMVWLPLTWLLAKSNVVPRPASVSDRLEGSVVIGLGQFLTWQYPIVVILFLHLLNIYIYFGKHPFWNYVSSVADKLVRPIQLTLTVIWGKLRRILGNSRATAYSPAVKAATKGLLTLVAMAMALFAAQLALRGLNWLYGRLPF